jgi:micrococcal nuclease
MRADSHRTIPEQAAIGPARSGNYLAAGKAAIVTWFLLCIAAAPHPILGQTLPATRGPIPGPIPAQVVHVVDGDTVTVDARIWLGQSVRVNVRLAGIDSPERKGACDLERDLARRARIFTEEKLRARPIELRHVMADKYGGRVIAKIITATGEDMGQALIEAGLARAYDGGRRRPWCEDALSDSRLSDIDRSGVHEKSLSESFPR